MRIVGGAWRGRTLVAPPGQATRPTADRVRQALFDMLLHAQWGGREVIEGTHVLDVFAGTGALGLEALSRGAASAGFIENDSAALKSLRANIAACGAGARATVMPVDALALNPGREGGGLSRRDARVFHTPARLVFLDPPYGQDFVPRALGALTGAGSIAPDALIIAETGRNETWQPDRPVLAERTHGAARVLVFRAV